MNNETRMKHWLSLWLLISMTLLLGSCALPPPEQPNNICKIFTQYPKWYWATQESEQKWGIPIAVQMAIIQQESSFKPKVKPARTKLLGFIPWFRPSTAYGYTQALEPTWEQYEQESGNEPARRTKFSDSADFLGWYLCKVRKVTGIKQYDAYALYLAYHEGIGGYQKKTYLKKPWLMNVAKKVGYQAKIYQQQLQNCQGSLPKRRFWNVFL